MSNTHDPPNAERKHVEQRAPRWKHRVVQNRHVLMAVLQVATATVKLVRLIASMFNSS